MRHLRSVVVLALAAAIAVGLSPSLSGCVAEDTALGRVAEAFGLGAYPLTDEATRELARFDAAFAARAADPENSRQLKQFRDAYRRVHTAYVEPTDDPALIDAAIRGLEETAPEAEALPARDLVEAALDAMTASLDPHSTYLDPQELRETRVATSGEFGGLGIQVTLEDGKVKVIAPIEDTPADRAGLRSGDRITHLDGASIVGIELLDAVRLMRGPPGTEIRLTVERDGVDPFDVAIVRSIIRIRAVRWRAEGDVGVVRIASFNEKAEAGVDEALAALRSALGDGARGLVLDLRNNPGGLFDQSLAVADAFLDDGVIVSVRGRDGAESRSYAAEPGDDTGGLPVVVLINAGSASASEIVAAALSENGRATVMGQRSFGKGSVQTVIPLPVEGALKLTTALYYAPSGRTIQRRGLAPDIVLVEGDAAGGAGQREADLPNALAADGAAAAAPRVRLDVADCPALGDDEDRALGCAVDFLRAGSTAAFLAGRGARGEL